MQLFREELESAQTSLEKQKARVWKLRVFIVWHYLLILISVAQSLLTLYVVIAVDVPFKGTLLLCIFASLVVSWLALSSGFSGGNRK